MPEEVDLLVVGGGPAGSAAAETALKVSPGMQVMLLEKRDAPHGTCAGGVGFNWTDEMDMRIPSHLRESAINDIAIHGPTETAYISRDDLGVSELGWVVDRWGFDKWLLARAEAAGANVLRGTEFKDIERDGAAWRIRALHKDGEFQVRARYVVDASGPMAVVAKRLGMQINEDAADIHTGLQYTVPLPENVPFEQIEMWFKRDKTPDEPWAVKSGYVWSFPTRHPYWDGASPVKAGRYTRLGIGVDLDCNKDKERSAKQCLDDFRACNADFNGPIVSTNGGLIPTGKPIQTSWDTVFLCGDSGRHTSALHGGGIWFGRVAGEEAGRVAANNGGPNDYDRAWKKRIGWTLKAHYALKRVLYDLSNDDMDLMVRELGKYELGSSNPLVEIPKAAMTIARHPVLGSKIAVKGFLEMARAAI